MGDGWLVRELGGWLSQGDRWLTCYGTCLLWLLSGSNPDISQKIQIGRHTVGKRVANTLQPTKIICNNLKKKADKVSTSFYKSTKASLITLSYMFKFANKSLTFCRDHHFLVQCLTDLNNRSIFRVIT